MSESEREDGLLVDAMNQFLCPQRTLAHPSMDEEEAWTVKTCGQPLYVTWETSTPLSEDYDLTADNATTSAWKLECEVGHTLATSDGQDEYPAPPKFDLLARVLAERTPA